MTGSEGLIILEHLVNFLILHILYYHTNMAWKLLIHNIFQTSDSTGSKWPARLHLKNGLQSVHKYRAVLYSKCLISIADKDKPKSEQCILIAQL